MNRVKKILSLSSGIFKQLTKADIMDWLGYLSAGTIKKRLVVC